MYNAKTVARLHLAVRTFGATDQPGDVHPDFEGVMYVAGGEEKQVKAKFEVNEVTGKKHLNLEVLDNGDGFAFVGKIMRDEAVQENAQYVGFLRQRTAPKLKEMTVDLLSDWQLEVSVEAVVSGYGVTSIAGNVFPPMEAARYSCNKAIRGSKLPF